MSSCNRKCNYCEQDFQYDKIELLANEELQQQAITLTNSNRPLTA